MQWPKNLQPTHARWERVADGFQEPNDNIINGTTNHRLSHLDPIYGRNFRIHDLYLESAPESSFSAPGADHTAEGLSSVPDQVLSELPTDCLMAFQQAREREVSWKTKWLTESVDGQRAHFLPSVEWYPK